MKTLSLEVERLMKYKEVSDALWDLVEHWDQYEERKRTVTLPDGKKIVIRQVRL